MVGKLFVLLLLGSVAIEAFPQTQLSQKNLLQANDELRYISNYDLIQEIENIIIRLLKEWLGEITENVKLCIQALMPEIKELAGQMLNDVISCGGGLQCIKYVVTANKDKLMGVFNKIKSCVTSLENADEDENVHGDYYEDEDEEDEEDEEDDDYNDYKDYGEISTDDLIQKIERVIVELLKKFLGLITEKVKQCLQASMPEIKEIASQMLNEVKECISGGGGFQCIQQIVNANMDKVKGVLNKIKACVTSLEHENDPDGVITDVIMKIIVDLIKKWLINVSANALECIKVSIPEIKDIAGQMVNDVKACMANGGSIFKCAQEVVNANKDKAGGVFNKIKCCNHNVIFFKEKIIERIKTLVGTSENVVKCIEQAMPEINALAAETSNEIQTCVTNGGDIYECSDEGLSHMLVKVKVIITEVKTCINA